MTGADDSAIDVEFSQAEYERLKAYADDRGISIPAAIRRAVDRWLAERDLDRQAAGIDIDWTADGRPRVTIGAEPPAVYRPHADGEDGTRGSHVF